MELYISNLYICKMSQYCNLLYKFTHLWNKYLTELIKHHEAVYQNDIINKHTR